MFGHGFLTVKFVGQNSRDGTGNFRKRHPIGPKIFNKYSKIEKWHSIFIICIYYIYRYTHCAFCKVYRLSKFDERTNAITFNDHCTLYNIITTLWMSSQWKSVKIDPHIALGDSQIIKVGPRRWRRRRRLLMSRAY